MVTVNVIEHHTGNELTFKADLRHDAMTLWKFYILGHMISVGYKPDTDKFMKASPREVVTELWQNCRWRIETTIHDETMDTHSVLDVSPNGLVTWFR